MYLSSFLALAILSVLLFFDYRRKGIRCYAAPVAALLGYVLIYVILFQLYLSGGGQILIQDYFKEVYIENASEITLVLVCGCALGYILASQATVSTFQRLPEVVYSAKLPLIFCAISVCCAAYMYAAGQLRLSYDTLNSPVEQVKIGYVLQALDLGIPASITLYFIDMKAGRVRRLTMAVIGLFVIIYMIAGARYRLFCLLLGIAAVWFHSRPTRYKVVTIAAVFFAVVPLAGAIALIRNYRAGLNFDPLSGASLLDMLSRGFNEASSTIAAGAVMEMVPRFFDFAGTAPILVALTQPIPRALWAAKPEPEYLTVVPMSLGPGAEYFGLALPLSGELYLIGGYIAVFVGSAAIFYLIERAFSKALVSKDVPLAAIIFLFVPTLLSRGYLAQAATLFVFVVVPVYIFRYFKSRSKARMVRGDIRLKRTQVG